jgi:hypothetical protein
VDGRDKPGHDDGTKQNFSSSFLLTRCLPFCSSGRLPTLSMPPAKTQALLACSRRAPPINSLAT